MLNPKYSAYTPYFSYTKRCATLKKMKKLILIFLIYTSSCNGQNKISKIENREKTQLKFELAKTEFVIMTFNTKWHWTFKNGKTSELTQLELIEIENILKIAINENNETQRNELIKHNKNYPKYQRTETGYELKLSGYRRQYVPIINKKGQKEIWINFFCDDIENDDWKNKIITVEDGGNCYYNIKINLNTKKYYELEINGNA